MYLIETPFYKANVKADGSFKIVPKAYVPEKKKAVKDLPRYPLIHHYEKAFKENYNKSLAMVFKDLSNRIENKPFI